MKFKNIDHLVITTANHAACTDFYRRLGFEIVEVSGRYEARAGSFKINIHQKGRELEPKAGNVAVGSADFCIETDVQIDDLLKHLSAAGLAIETGPVLRHGTHGSMQSVYLRDPDSNLIELCCYDIIDVKEHIDFYEKRDQLHKEMMGAITRLMKSYSCDYLDLTDNQYDAAYIVPLFNHCEKLAEYRVKKVRLQNGFVEYLYNEKSGWHPLSDSFPCMLNSLYDAIYYRLVKREN